MAYTLRTGAKRSLDHDLIVVATPMKMANDDPAGTGAAQAARRHVRLGFAQDAVARRAFDALQDAGCRVTSIHPMFGPDTELLSGRHVIFIDLGTSEAVDDAQTLFASTMAERVVMSLESTTG